ncbi:hypothetical protein RSK20926_12994 [Roseobacter sp. SK209-2-6]|nr:hypothetical protein RSK20926_12994 [Roseobacter sp. SK209-2-6]
MVGFIAKADHKPITINAPEDCGLVG